MIPKVRPSQLRRADLERVCQQRGWRIIKTYQVEETASSKTSCQQFEAILEDAGKSEFEVVVTWSFDGLSQEGEWPVSHIIPTLRNWDIHFSPYSEPFLDTTGPFGEFLVPLFAWLACHASCRKGKAVRLGMGNAKGKPIGRWMIVDKLDGIVLLRAEAKSWREIA